MIRAFEPSLTNLNIVLGRLQRCNRAESLHFRKCLGLAKRFVLTLTFIIISTANCIMFWVLVRIGHLFNDDE